PVRQLTLVKWCWPSYSGDRRCGCDTPLMSADFAEARHCRPPGRSYRPRVPAAGTPLPAAGFLSLTAICEIPQQSVKTDRVSGERLSADAFQNAVDQSEVRAMLCEGPERYSATAMCSALRVGGSAHGEEGQARQALRATPSREVGHGFARGVPRCRDGRLLSLAVRRVFRRADAIARARWQPGDPALAQAAARTPPPRSGTRSPYLADEFGCGVAGALSPAPTGHRRLLAAGADRPPALTGRRSEGLGSADGREVGAADELGAGLGRRVRLDARVLHRVVDDEDVRARVR